MKIVAILNYSSFKDNHINCSSRTTKLYYDNASGILGILVCSTLLDQLRCGACKEWGRMNTVKLYMHCFTFERIKKYQEGIFFLDIVGINQVSNVCSPKAQV